MNRKQRDSNRDNALWLNQQYGPKSICPKCGKPGRHFAPPCFGEEGFFVCDIPFAKVMEGLCKLEIQ